MRKTRDSQPSLTYSWLDLDHAKELKAVSALLDKHPRLLELVLQDLSGDGQKPVCAKSLRLSVLLA